MYATSARLRIKFRAPSLTWTRRVSRSRRTGSPIVSRPERSMMTTPSTFRVFTFKLIQPPVSVVVRVHRLHSSVFSFKRILSAKQPAGTIGPMRSYLSRLTVVAGIFMLSIGVGVLVTQEGGRVPLLPDQVALTPGIHEFTWSPDSKSIAYISAQSGQSEVWVISSAGGPSKRLTSNSSQKKQPHWSADGKWITYVAVQPGGLGDIEIVSAEGEETINLTESAADD